MNGGPSAPALLEERGLFHFAGNALEEMAQAFEDLGVTDDRSIGERPARQVFGELVALTAAEYALIPILVEPRPILPVPEPIEVNERSARLALLKTACVGVYYCVGRAPLDAGLRLTDVTAFSGDVTKLEAAGLSVSEPPDEIGDVARAIDALEHYHRESSVPLVRDVGESGVLRLQGFLWAVKLSLPRAQDLREVVNDSYAAFELAHPTAAAATMEPG